MNLQIWCAVVWLMLLSSSGLTAQRSQGDLCFVWYNVENLFHPDNDSLPGDDEFTPEGLRHWTPARYRSKISVLAKVIIASGGWEPPDLVGLCEVEDSSVLNDLVFIPSWNLTITPASIGTVRTTGGWMWRVYTAPKGSGSLGGPPFLPGSRPMGPAT